jgi:GT2 family glycosyltransferase/glycosyltransferase involved in cell wall biosynthesis
VQVSFIIPVFNQLALTQACIGSLKSSLPADLTCEVILVDDGSSDGTREFLRELPPPYTVLLNDRNLGYAASNNRGARVAQGEFLALLNNDLVLQPGWLEPMLAAFIRHPRAGLVGNIQLAADTGEVDHVGIIFRDGGYPVHQRESVAVAQARGEFAIFPGGVTAACCVVRREWFLRRGGFDEGYRNGFEDNDLCLRAREDGFVNLTATRSIVRHHISRSPGRAIFEFRNAQRFLARWGLRTAALQKQFEVSEARSHAAQAAAQFFRPVLRRLGFGPATVRRQHRRALAAARREQVASTRPVRIGVDLLRLAPGGGNGGIKPLVFSFLSEIGRQRGAAFNFAVFAERSLRDELSSVLRIGDFVLEPAADAVIVLRKDPKLGWREVSRFARSDDIATRAQLDALYCPFGVSEFMRPALPTVSLIVDLLHRALPAALPPEEVAYRDSWFKRVASDATYIQGISENVISRLGVHYGVARAKCFHTYIPAQNRLPVPSAESPFPAGLPNGPFFFYPANFWPHKNHETLLVAYRLYLQGAGSRAWPLVLTGAPDARMTLLKELAAGLGLTEVVHFLGHLDDLMFAGVWARAGALVFPSLHEGFGIPLLEAMRFGVPIIASESTSIPEVAGDACVFVDPADPKSIADVLRRIAIREGLRDDLVARGRVRLAAFSLELEAGRLAHFLDSAARRQVP